MKMDKHITAPVKIISITLCLALFIANCGSQNDAGTRVGNPPTVSTTSAFPASLAIASPLENSDSLSELPALLRYTTTEGRSAYEEAVDRINTILEGDSLSACNFDPSHLLQHSGNAQCYGPNVAYANHPDTLPGQQTSGTLPPGDLGLWAEYDEQTGQACAADQLNLRMRGMQFKTQSSLEALASLLCVASVNSIELPESGSVDLTEEMVEMSASNNIAATFTSAELSVATNEDDTVSYSYELNFSFTDDDGAHDVIVRMTHVALSDEGDYKGRFSYVVEDADAVQNNCPTDGITHAGSILYAKSAEADLDILGNEGGFCGQDIDPVQSNGLIDPNDAYDGDSNTDGWGLNFSTFVANTNTETLAGNYSLVWQAGPQDDNTRAFNVALNASEDPLSGTAFFGYGDPISETDGSITGFICNWAGPGGSHAMQDFVQRQSLEENADGLFDSVSADLAIGYAPTNSCDYDGQGTFSYDLDPDMNATDMSDPALAVANDLLDLTDTTFTDAGFTLPIAPENF